VGVRAGRGDRYSDSMVRLGGSRRRSRNTRGGHCLRHLRGPLRTPFLILSGLAYVAASSAAPAVAQTIAGPPVTLLDSASAPAPGSPYPSPVPVAGEGIRVLHKRER
jgi:hypothetical protein